MFLELRDKLQPRIDALLAMDKVYQLEADNNALWDAYLEGFEDPTERQSHNCNTCKGFLRNVIVVGIKDGKRYNIWDFQAPEVFRKAVGNLKELVDTLPIKGLVTPVQQKFGAQRTMQNVDGEIKQWNHFYIKYPRVHMNTPTKASRFRASYDVLKRGMEEIPEVTLSLVIDLINQGSLLNGSTYINKVKAYRELKRQYNELKGNKDLWLWENAGTNISTFRNDLIGVLCTELAEGKDLTAACLAWNKRVDPTNYKRAKAPVTKAQVKLGEKLVNELGLMPSFQRRVATLADIRADQILHMNEEEVKVSMFDSIKTKHQHSRAEFKNLTEVSIDKFMKDILPEAQSVELFLENRMQGNLFTMFTTVDNNVKDLFNYGNSYSFTTSDNLAGKSQISSHVKEQGGNLGEVRFSIRWADGNGDNSDLDAHCKCPEGLIYFDSDFKLPGKTPTGGQLDIDVTNPKRHLQTNKAVVENITWPIFSNMPNGKYTFLVHQYSAYNSQGFTAEFEIMGEVFSYSFNKPVKGKVKVVTMTKQGNNFSLEHHLPEANASRKMYDLDSNEFHPVNLVCLSPNHWDKPIGNKHYMFGLKGCKANKELRTFHTVDLIPELHDARKVIDYLGFETQVKPKDDQVSGVCFNATVKDHVILKVKGTHQRIIKVIF